MRAVCLLFALAIVNASSGFAQNLPRDVDQTACPVLAEDIRSWFAGGMADGIVKPPNSLKLVTDNGNCNFYQWSEQMFLYLTSPASSGFGTGLVFDSEAFYDVSPESNGRRQFIPHTPAKTRTLAIRTAKPGPHGLSVIVDKAGRLFELLPPRFAKNGKQLVQNEQGKQVEIWKATISKKGVLLYGKDGKLITRPKPILPAELKGARLAQAILRDGLPSIFIDSAGNPVNVYPGQAGGNEVLLAQNGSIVYYVTTVNDFYAYFLTGQKNGAFPATLASQFPTTEKSRDMVVDYAKRNHATIANPDALAVEIKTSWVETTTVPDPSNYITMKATIPVWDTHDPNKWQPSTKTRTATLALVGMHVVGSTQSHPEMLWATFEHFGNTPNARYAYKDVRGRTNEVVENPHTWLFSSSKASDPNVARAKFLPGVGTIVGANHFPISPSDTLREKAFGAASDKSPNREVTSAASNSQIIAINNRVIKVLAERDGDDVRTNYYLVGCTWTDGGTKPTDPYPDGNEVGTSQLSNSTMETYQQAGPKWATASNCFACHGKCYECLSEDKITMRVSHVYEDLQPLPVTTSPKR